MRRRRWLSSTSHVLPICTLGSALGLTCSAGGPTVKGLVREDWGVFMQGWNPSASAAWLSCRLCSCGLSLPLPLHCQGMSSV